MEKGVTTIRGHTKDLCGDRNDLYLNCAGSQKTIYEVKLQNQKRTHIHHKSVLVKLEKSA